MQPAKPIPGRDEWERGYNACLNDLVRPLEALVARLQWELRSASEMFAAAVASQPDQRLIVRPRVTRETRTLQRANDPFSDEIVFTVR